MDRAKLMAHLLEKSERCTMCGTSGWEWDPEQGGDRNAYEPAAHNCMGCYHIKLAQQDTELMPGASITLVPKSQKHRLKAAIPA